MVGGGHAETPGGGGPDGSQQLCVTAIKRKGKGNLRWVPYIHRFSQSQRGQLNEWYTRLAGSYTNGAKKKMRRAWRFLDFIGFATRASRGGAPYVRGIKLDQIDCRLEPKRTARCRPCRSGRAAA